MINPWLEDPRYSALWWIASKSRSLNQTLWEVLWELPGSSLRWVVWGPSANFQEFKLWSNVCTIVTVCMQNDINDLCLLLTGIQDSQEQSSSSTQREALSSVTNRFELQEVLKTMDTLDVMVVNLECMQRSIVLYVWLSLVLSLTHFLFLFTSSCLSLFLLSSIS